MSKPRNATYDVRAGDVPRDLFPTGRVKFSLGVPRSSSEEQESSGRKKTKTEDVRRRELMEMLRQSFAWDILYAIQHGTLHVADVCRRMQQRGERAIREMQLELMERDMIDEAAAVEREVEPVPTFQEQVEDYLAFFGSYCKPSSYRTRSSRLKVFGEQTREDGTALNDVSFDQVTSDDVRTALDAIGGKPNTRESYRIAVSAVYTWSNTREAEKAEKEGRQPRLRSNPASLVKSVPRDARPVAASEEQIIALFHAAAPYQKAYVRTMVHVGLREGELQHVRRGLDLDLGSWILRIQRRGPDPRCICDQCTPTDNKRPRRRKDGEDSVLRAPVGGEGWKPKNTNGTRSLHIPETPKGLRESILTMLQAHPVEHGDFMFRNPATGRPWTVKALQDDFAALCERAGVTYGRDVQGGITIHSLRHSCATNLVRAGVALPVIADLLGDTVETITKTYVNLNEHDLGKGISAGPSFETGTADE